MDTVRNATGVVHRTAGTVRSGSVVVCYYIRSNIVVYFVVAPSVIIP